MHWVEMTWWDEWIALDKKKKKKEVEMSDDSSTGKTQDELVIRHIYMWGRRDMKY